MGKPNWSYQDKMIAEVLANVREGIGPNPDSSKGCVLAGGTSSGKTRMALQIVDQLLKEGIIKAALVLTYGQIVLRSQMAEEKDKLQAAGLISFSSDVVSGKDATTVRHHLPRSCCRAFLFVLRFVCLYPLVRLSNRCIEPITQDRIADSTDDQR
jgi:hypothetical protein